MEASRSPCRLGKPRGSLVQTAQHSASSDGLREGTAGLPRFVDGTKLGVAAPLLHDARGGETLRLLERSTETKEVKFDESQI